MNLNSGGLDGRFAQYQAGQGQPGTGGFPGLAGGAGGMQGGLPAMSGSAYTMQGLQAGRPGGLGGLAGAGSAQAGLVAQQQRLGGAGLAPGMHQLGMNPGGQSRLGLGGQQYGAAHGANGMAQLRAGGLSAQPGMIPNPPGLSQQPLMAASGRLPAGAGGLGNLGSLTGVGGANLSSALAAFQQQQQQQQQRGLQGGGVAAVGPTRLGLGGIGGGPGSGGGYGAPSGDLLSMLNKAGPQRPADDGPSFNASDFPSLTASGQGQRSASQGGDANDSFAALLGTQKLPGMGQGGAPGQGPAFGEEDFPALPGAPQQQQHRREGQEGAAQLQQLQAQLGNFALDGTGGSASAGLEALRMQQQRQLQLQQQQQQQAAAAAAAAAGGMKPPAPVSGLSPGRGGLAASDRYGLLGLLSVIRMTDPDVTTLALGTDLTTLGLNLNSPEALWKTFASPWADGPSKPEPDFKVPQCYLAAPPRLTPAYFSRFQPDTLFYIFYGMPGDEAQLYAAEELAQRGWYYHREFKAWLTRAPNTEPLQKTDRFERGSFFLFDPSTWDVARKDNFVVQFEALERPPAVAKAGGGPLPPPGMGGAGSPGQQQQQPQEWK